MAISPGEGVVLTSLLSGVIGGILSFKAGEAMGDSKAAHVASSAMLLTAGAGVTYLNRSAFTSSGGSINRLWAGLAGGANATMGLTLLGMHVADHDRTMYGITGEWKYRPSPGRGN